MATTVKVRDENTAGTISHELMVEMLTERVTARELIRSRVYQEVQDYNLKQHQSGPFRGLVQPEETEQLLNGPQKKTARSIDWKKQFDRALEAFESSQMLLLIDDRQVESLDEEFEIRPDSVATFLRLTLLVGG
ncbi:MAG TPA: hypothetical protein VFT74_21385 [Isosphaeraceae bacterium]|nr:hypothetical protein [Isosphaeraceae bacterium]